MFNYVLFNSLIVQRGTEAVMLDFFHSSVSVMMNQREFVCVLYAARRSNRFFLTMNNTDNNTSDGVTTEVSSGTAGQGSGDEHCIFGGEVRMVGILLSFQPVSRDHSLALHTHKSSHRLKHIHFS